MREVWSIIEELYSEVVSYNLSTLCDSLWVVHDVLIKFMQKS